MHISGKKSASWQPVAVVKLPNTTMACLVFWLPSFLNFFPDMIYVCILYIHISFSLYHFHKVILSLVLWSKDCSASSNQLKLTQTSSSTLRRNLALSQFLENQSSADTVFMPQTRIISRQKLKQITDFFSININLNK